MAKVTSRVELIEYCLRRLGFPVIEINVDDDQIQDRIDDCFDFYMDYHFDGTERTYYAIELSQADVDNGYVSVPDSLIYIGRAIPFASGSSGVGVPTLDGSVAPDMFHRMFGTAHSSTPATSSVNDQAGASNDLALTTYALKMQYMELINSMFGSGDEIPIRFNRHTNRVYMDESTLGVGDYLVVEGYSSLDPEVYTDVYNDRWVKRYATALIKRQWAENLKKYGGIQLPGGVTLNGADLYSEATTEINELEDEMQDKYEEPPRPILG